MRDGVWEITKGVTEILGNTRPGMDGEIVPEGLEKRQKQKRRHLEGKEID